MADEMSVLAGFTALNIFLLSATITSSGCHFFPPYLQNI
jgi:hypothetical protein